jgi:hypothetical protein
VSETRVVNMRNAFDLRIDRRTNLGNPFHIGLDGNRAEVIAKHMLLWRAHLDSPHVRDWAMASLKMMKGKRLGCHCKPLACHGDNYVALIAEFC